ncbi:Uncharacterised protein [Shewanella baltica]|uniref:EpsG family protein n=1 Tax=Shewanella baltica TaxID=62322 RepID=UPI000F6F580A|nr:EpsG family protein [Shewanella baltica]VEF25372.1 Uncharacterised protein [Shewanella baltica]
MNCNNSIVNFFYNKKIDNANVLIFSLCLLIFPFLLLISTLFVKNKYAQYIFILYFSFLFGYAFDYTNVDMDSNHYASFFLNLNEVDFYAFFEHHVLGVFQHPDALDLFQPVTSYLVAQLFPGNIPVLFAFFSCIFVTFQMMTYSLINSEHKRNFTTLILLLSFAFAINPLTNINGIRFWLACWVYVYFTTKYLNDKSNKYFFLSCLAFLVHWSFVLTLPILLLFKYWERLSVKVILSLFIISLTTHSFVVDVFFAIGDFLPNTFQLKFDYYSSQVLDTGNRVISLPVIIGTKGFTFYLLSVFIYLSIFKKVRFISNHRLLRFWKFTAFFVSVFLFFSVLSSAARFLSIAELLIVMFVFMFFQEKQNNGVPFYILMFVPFLILRVLVQGTLLPFFMTEEMLSPLFFVFN